MMKPKNLLFIATLGLVGCNTFGDPPGFAGDTGDAGGDDGGDTIWEPRVASEPQIDVDQVADELAACPDIEVELTQSVAMQPQLHLDTLVGDDDVLGDTWVATYVDQTNSLQIDLINGEFRRTPLFTSEFAVLSPASGATVATADLGLQLMVAAVSEDGSVQLVQCSIDGDNGCRTSATEVEASIVELAAIGPQFRLYVPGAERRGVLEHTIDVESGLTVSTGTNPAWSDDALFVLSIDAGVIEGGVQSLAVGVEDSSMDLAFYRFARNVNGGWVTDNPVQSPVAATIDNPRAEFLHLENQVWVVQGSDLSAGLDVDNITTDGNGVWNHGVNWGMGIRDFDFAPIDGGYAEAYVNSNGVTKVALYGPGDTMSVDDRVQFEGADLLLERPTRVAVANATPALVGRRTASLVFYPLCAAAP